MSPDASDMLAVACSCGAHWTQRARDVIAACTVRHSVLGLGGHRRPEAPRPHVLTVEGPHGKTGRVVGDRWVEDENTTASPDGDRARPGPGAEAASYGGVSPASAATLSSPPGPGASRIGRPWACASWGDSGHDWLNCAACLKGYEAHVEETGSVA